jgi:hypothetical protein
MRLQILIIAVSMLWTTRAVGQEHLSPEIKQEGTLEAYETTVHQVLREAFETDVKFRVIILPSFRPEVAIGLRQGNDRFEIFSISPTRQIWTYQLIYMMKTGQVVTLGGDGATRQADEIKRMEAGLPPDPANLPLVRCAIGVDKKVAADITDVWKRMLEEVRSDDDLSIGLDGETYHFSMTANGRALAGQAWSPYHKTRVGKLVTIAYAMRDYCQTQKAKHLRQLSSLAKQVLRRD